MRKRLSIAAIAAMTMWAGSAAAQDIAALERQIEQARNAAPIVVVPFVAVKEPAQYFGNYEPRANTVYERGEKMYFYGEPKNLMFPKNAKGIYQPAFEVDLEVTGPGGASMKQPRFANFKLDSRSRIQDLYLNLDVALNQAPPGKYNVKFVIRDKNSSKSAAFAQDVTIK